MFLLLHVLYFVSDLFRVVGCHLLWIVQKTLCIHVQVVEQFVVNLNDNNKEEYIMAAECTEDVVEDVGGVNVSTQKIIYKMYCY
jgi:hypothetical protein